MKKETLEEAAENYVGYTVGFYKTEELQGINDFIAGVKWQQERSYSEEEVLDLLKALQIGYYIHNERVDIDKWFEQFEKK